MPNLDIHTGVQAAFLISLLLSVLCFVLGIRTIRAGNRLQYFRKRHDRVVQGWRMIFIAALFGIASFVTYSYAEPVAYRIYPPSPTVTLTPTITVTPTISPTLTITVTPTITNTPSITNTPAMPQEVEQKFESTITPQAGAIFSPLQFARKLDEKSFLPVEPAVEFNNPIVKIYGVFSYDKMTPGAQWTALWYRNGELVFYESVPWSWGTGGYGYTEWGPPSNEWLPGTYEVQIFVGNQWIENASGTFIVTGEPPTPRPTASPSRTPKPTNTIGPTSTRTSTPTPTITRTPTITLTPTITKTPTITRTPRPTDTRWPTVTSKP